MDHPMFPESCRGVEALVTQVTGCRTQLHQLIKLLTRANQSINPINQSIMVRSLPRVDYPMFPQSCPGVEALFTQVIGCNSQNESMKGQKRQSIQSIYHGKVFPQCGLPDVSGVLSKCRSPCHTGHRLQQSKWINERSKASINPINLSW